MFALKCWAIFLILCFRFFIALTDVLLPKFCHTGGLSTFVSCVPPVCVFCSVRCSACTLLHLPVLRSILMLWFDPSSVLSVPVVCIRLLVVPLFLGFHLDVGCYVPLGVERSYVSGVYLPFSRFCHHASLKHSCLYPTMFCSSQPLSNSTKVTFSRPFPMISFHGRHSRIIIAWSSYPGGTASSVRTPTMRIVRDGQPWTQQF